MKKRLVVYPAIFDDSENKKGVYSVEFPDVPDALTYGNSLAEALDRAPEALGLSLYELETLPKSSDINIIREKNPQAIVNLVSVDLEKIRLTVKVPYVRKNTTLPADIAQQAEERNINFSETLLEGLKQKLKP
ncbi:type II toxin-antitoxin system HicB family antitoxin [Companilactobacillus jidongensis]|uniref:type II toxin-antitoxin system HicB family antitoxin n=1 Tax=Companilactobacillus jidongensis TaxID=2486006 RepID=UPI000F781316|nr:type II toxin-antitoxin system HicB family antitoxin [Companilactobacillus jidongensis]